MKRTALFFASTAILFSSPSAMAEQAPLNRPYISSNSNTPLILAQAEQAAPAQEDPAQEELKRKAVQQAEEQAKQQADEQAKQQAEEVKRAAQAEAEKAAEQQKAVEEEANRKAAEDAKAAKAAEAEAAQQAEEAKRAAQAEADKAAEQQKAVEEEVKRKAAEEAKAAKAAEKQAAEDANKAKRDAEAEANKTAEQQKAVEEEARKKAAAESDAAKAAEQETAKQAEQAKKATEHEAAKAEEAQKAAEEDARKKAESTQKAADKQAEKAAEDARKAADEAAKQTQPATEAPATADKPAGEKPATAPDQATGESTPAKPADTATGQQATPAPADAAQPAPQEASPLPANAAPVLDSDKPAPGTEAKDRGQGKRNTKSEQAGQAPSATEQPVAQQPETPAAPAPKSDADVQQAITPIKIEPVLVEKGTRIKQARRDERPADVQVIKQYDNRAIVEVNNNVFVESSDRPRMTRNAQDVYYEDLPRRRTRETIVRDNGVQIVTIRNRYGDVIQRSRITPDGREVLLTYAPDYDREERITWRDPGDDLPQLRLDIPVRDYILDAEEAPEEEVYDFFARPPVERVERIYSVDEVKRSARIRDKVRRVDLDTITFAFGSAEIGEDQIERLDSVAKAMAQTLKKNPAETFLIEGHTDAVGSDQANLVLSDKRAESVAQALTNVFDIPPENMATQGYGERYLKIRTESPEQQNRRVAIRRITPLVAPVASNN
ncbi:MAG: OmpA family protein [Phyllobacterium sp.]|uniref:OmpA family protein n=1 Tax=Phyllobacterium sp. TaxID=1871046 RepID=UPI0030F30130